MSSATDTPIESIAWAGLTAFFTWILFGALTVANLIPPGLVADTWFIATIAGAGLGICILDVWDQNRELNVIVISMLFVVVSFAMVIVGRVPVSVPILGLTQFPFAAIIGEKVIEQFSK